MRKLLSGPLVLTLSVSASSITALSACGWGTGSAFMEEPLSAASEVTGGDLPKGAPSSAVAGPKRKASITLDAKESVPADVQGQNLGFFRNTYYDFPAEADFKGEPVAVRDVSCGTIATVPRPFFEALCVQGSGSLTKGSTVSFGKRDCACAELCPRTGQKICFEALDSKAFPWGRGAAGRPITPLRSVAADTTLLPMGTSLYVPELDGLPLGEGGTAHDGCLVVEDRGLRVHDNHIDIFTGRPQTTERIEEMLPSNQGVHVVVGTRRCERPGRR